MTTSAIRLPRRRFLKARGNVVELAVGLLVVSMLQAEAHAETLGAPDGAAGSVPPTVPASLAASLAAIDPTAIRTMSIDELKALLDANALASLGLDADFLKLFDTDAAAAIHRLELAFRDKIKAVAKGEAKIAATNDAPAGEDDPQTVREGADAHHESDAAGFSPLWLLAGLAAVGGGVGVAGGGGGGDDAAPAPAPTPAANVAPTANADTVTTTEDAAVTFDVRTNDSDRDGGTLSVTQINGTAITATSPVAITGGAISLGADGRLTFTPTANYNGTPSFTYTISDGQGGTATATASLTVTAVNDAPVAAADAFTTAEDTAVVIDVRANDRDVDVDALTVTQVNGTAVSTSQAVAVTGGSVILNAAGNLVFTPTANYNGAPSFTYTLSDGKGGSTTATVAGNVTAVNDAPVNGLPGTVPVASQGVPIAIRGLTVADVDGDAGSFTTTLTVTHGVLVAGTVAGGATVTGNGGASITLVGTLAQVNASLGAIAYTGSARYSGADTLTIVTSDGQATDTDVLPLTVAQVTTGVVIDGYVAGAQIFFDANGNGVYDDGEVVATTDAQGRFALVGTPQGTMIAIGGFNTDTGLPNTIVLKAPAGSTAVTPLTTIIAELVESGVSLATAQAQVAQAFGLPFGIDLSSFDFLAPGGDAALAFAVQKVAVQIATLMIQASNAGLSSTAVGEQLGRMASAGTTIDLGNPAQLGSLLAAAGMDPAQAALVSQTAAAINQAIAAATTPGGLVDTVRDLNQPDAHLPPVVTADSAKFGLGVPAVLHVTGNDTSASGDVLNVVAVDGTEITVGQSVTVENGFVTLGEDGSLTFVPTLGFFGSQSFSYTVADSQGATATGIATASLAGPVLPVAADQVGYAADQAAALAAAGVVTLDIASDVATLDDGQANALIEAGIDFAEADEVTLEVSGTTLDTSLKGLQSLHVDSIKVAVGVSVLGLDAGGSLASIDAAGLPQFDLAQSDAALAVTLTVDAGQIDATVDLAAIAAALSAAGIDHLGVAGNGQIALTAAQGLALADSGIDFADAADVTLAVDAGEALALATDPTLLAALHVDHLDVAGDAVDLDDAMAGRLVAAGVDFAEGDTVTVTAEGTQLNTTLKGLQSLHVDSVAVRAGVVTLALDAGGSLGSLSAADLPRFDQAQSDAALDVTLNVEAGTIDPTLDLGMLAADLGAVGIDHLGVAGTGELSLNLTQAQALADGGLDFATAADITLDVTAAQTLQLASDPALLAALNVDHLDAGGGAIGITDAQAANLIGAGVDFAEGDTVTLNADGTQLNTSLKGLQSLHVDSVAVRAGVLTLALDAGGALGSLNAADLPSFTVAQSDAALDVTLNVDAGLLDPVFDLGALADGLREAGVDHIGVAGTGDLGVSLAHATGMAEAGLDFTAAADVTLHLAVGEVGVVADDPWMVAGLQIDTLDVQGDLATITDAQAANLVDAGLHFADADIVTVEAQGTQLSTSLRGLHDLKVDSVAVVAGVSVLHVDAGDLTGIAAADLPQFDVAQSDDALDVTLRVDAGELGELARLGEAFAAAGVDHIAINQPLDTLDPGQTDLLATITRSFGIDFVYEAFDAPEAGQRVASEDLGEASLYRELIAAFEAAEDHGTGGSVELADGTASALAEAGMLRAYTADVVVVDGTQSGDKLLTSLKDIANLGIDEVRLPDQGSAPVYVDLGLDGDGDAASEIRALLQSLDQAQSGPEPIFTGADKVALVLDADAAHALASVDGAVAQLQAMGITEIDVLADADGGAAPAFGDTGMDIKLIGQDDELYRHLHHDR